MVARMVSAHFFEYDDIKLKVSCKAIFLSSNQLLGLTLENQKYKTCYLNLLILRCILNVSQAKSPGNALVPLFKSIFLASHAEISDNLYDIIITNGLHRQHTFCHIKLHILRPRSNN